MKDDELLKLCFRTIESANSVLDSIKGDLYEMECTGLDRASFEMGYEKVVEEQKRRLL